MANNFKLTGDYYIAKQLAGNDSNDGLDPNSPKVTRPNVTYNNIITGSGVYDFLGNFRDGQADGLVIINATGNINLVPIRTNGFFGFIFNMNNNNLTINNVSPSLFTTNCKIKNANDFQGQFNNCVILNSTSLGNSIRDLKKSIIKESTYKPTFGASSIFNNYFNFNSVISLDVSLTPSNFFNNNIEGVIRIFGNLFNDSTNREYAIKDQFTGTPQDNGYAAGVEWLSESQLTADGYTGTISGWDAAVSTCINRDPKFNNVALEDFSLQADSPHIGAADDGSNIGGTEVALSTLVNDDGVGTIEVIPSPEIDTSITNSWKLNTGETEGFIDIIQRVSTESLVLGVINPLSALNFDSDFVGGTPQNNNVPDSEPLTVNYPRKLTTTSLAPDTTTVNVTGHNVQVGEFVRIAGEDREVTAVATDSFTVDSPFRAAVASGVTFQVGTENELAALRPNRLTYLLRTSNQTEKPTQDSEWDNDVDPIYGVAGDFLTQEWFTEPGYVIDGSNNVFGLGDSERDPSLSSNQIACKWLQIRIYIRNNYES